jgi:two-component system sensor histidine kinase UhpB
MRSLFWIGLIFFVILNVAVYWMLGRWLQPLRPMLKAINKMEHGDLSTRLPNFDLPEFDRIGHSLNRMAESLAAERQLEENRQLTALIQEHIEDERRSLARELHDGLGQYVTAIKTFAVAIAKKTEKDSSKVNLPEISAHAQTIVGAANHIYDGMHDIIRQLRPGSLDNLGLSETLRDMVNHTQKQYPNLKMRLDLAGNLDNLGENLNINLYRIVQESINNAIKHAEAKNIATKTGALQLTISDDGLGMDIDAVDHANHFGLLGMRERVQGFMGSFHVESEPNANGANKGTTIYINIPARDIN